MLPKTHRLPALVMKDLMRQGKRVRFTQGVFFYTYASATDTDSRFAVVIASRISKRATERNRIKRLVRESVHHILPLIVKKADGVFVIQKQTSDSQTDVESIIKGVLTEAGLL